MYRRGSYNKTRRFRIVKALCARDAIYIYIAVLMGERGGGDGEEIAKLPFTDRYGLFSMARVILWDRGFCPLQLLFDCAIVLWKAIAEEFERFPRIGFVKLQV